MTDEQVKRFLRYRKSALVDFALSSVNLTWKERQTVELCGKQGYTQEQAAEQMERSVDAVQKWYRTAFSKIREEWGEQEWISILLQNIK